MESTERRLLEKVHDAYSAPTWWYDFRGFFILILLIELAVVTGSILRKEHQR
jgi:hypothetical protein